MNEYPSLGTSIEENDVKAKPIKGLGTSTAGFLGETERGPTTPTLITSWPEYQRIFGSFFNDDKYLPYAVQGFFVNGGKRCFISRITKKTATAASITLNNSDNSPAINILALGEGSWGNRIVVKVAQGKTSSTFRLAVFYWKNLPATLFNPENDLKSTPRPAVSEVFDNLSMDESSPDYYLKKINANSSLVSVVEAFKSSKTLSATGLQALQNGLDTSELAGTASKQPIDDRINLGPNAPTDVDFSNLCILLVGGTGAGQTRVITKYDENTKTATVDKVWDTNPDDTTTYRIEDPIINLGDYIRADADQPGKRKGLSSIGDIDEVSIIYAPNSQSIQGLTEALIEQCELQRDRFGIIDALENTSLPTKPADTKYAALYYPWVKVVNQNTGLIVKAPPGGFVAGIFAHSDAQKGVWKAPANEVVQGVIGTEFLVLQGQQDILSPVGINCVRAFPGRGIRLWGARTMSSDPLWKYVNVRRLFTYLEQSIEMGTQWVIFEPNSERLWAHVKQTISQFLTSAWKSGALMGKTPEEAFFVTCDRTTMTQDNIDNGKLIVMIGVAPVKPAEFVVFRISQWQGGSAATE
jgi:uncharacterized protein